MFHSFQALDSKCDNQQLIFSFIILWLPRLRAMRNGIEIYGGVSLQIDPMLVFRRPNKSFCIKFYH